jgi:serine/threonine protein kinase
MGTVYEALDERLDTTVALKESHFTEELLRKQFEREARLLARLRHPAMTRVIDHFTDGEGQFLVMDFIVGEDLWGMLQRNGGPFSPDKVLEWADQLLDALNYLHRQEPPIIHRDIKPHNLKVTNAGQIILLDFGLAKGFTGQISRVTTSGSIFGYTPNYAPLEQIQGTGTDPRSDLFSLAATLYHLITGKITPDALSRATAIMSELPDPLLPANEVNDVVPASVADVIHLALSNNPAKRPTSATEMRSMLRKASIIPEKDESLNSTVISPTESADAGARTREAEETVLRSRREAEGSWREAEHRKEPEQAQRKEETSRPRVVDRKPETRTARMSNQLSWVLGTTRKRLLIIVGFTTLITSLTAIYLYRKPNIYESNARLLVVPAVQGPVHELTIVSSTPESRLAPVMSLGRSPDFLRRAIQESRAPLSDGSLLIDAAKDSLHFEIRESGQSLRFQGDEMDVSFQYLDPEAAAKFVNIVTMALVSELNGNESSRSTASPGPKLSVTDYALPDKTPVGPHRLEGIIIALLSSLAFSLGITLLLEYLFGTRYQKARLMST